MERRFKKRLMSRMEGFRYKLRKFQKEKMRMRVHELERAALVSQKEEMEEDHDHHDHDRSTLCRRYCRCDRTRSRRCVGIR